MKKILFVAFCLLSVTIGNTQSVGIGNESPDSSAILDLSNLVNKGLLIPSMTTAQKFAIEYPADGLLVYQTDSIPGFYFYDGTAWGRIGGGGNAWEETNSTVYTSKIVGIGNSNPDTTAILDLSNPDSKGVLIPSMTTAEKDAIDDPADGLLVYQIDSIPGFYFYNGIVWGRIGGGGNAWEETDSTVYTSKIVGIGNSSPDTSAILDLSNPDNKGVLIPSMTTAQKNAVVVPANGLMVYQTDSIPGFYFFDGTAWGRIGGGGNAWEETDSTVYTSKIVGIGNSSPDTSAILDLSNPVNKGVLIPSMTTAAKDAIADPANGLLVYQTDSIPGFYFYDTSAWGRIGGGGNAWEETDSTVYTSKFVGINTNDPNNHLDVHGNLVITEPAITTASIPTPAQTITLINNSQFIYYDVDSTGRFFDPGGPNGQYGANITNATCFIFPSSNTIGYELTIEEIDLGAGDSLIIRRSGPSGDILYALGNQNSLTGNFLINETVLHFLFKSDASNSTLGDGFSILFKRLLPDPSNQAPKGFAGKTLIFNTQSGSFMGGIIDNFDEIGENSFSYGYKNESTGIYSTALGSDNVSSGNSSLAVGISNLSSSLASCTIGNFNEAIGEFSIAAGNETRASGHASFSTGHFTLAAGAFAFASGINTIANGYAGMVIGMNNTPIVDPQNSATETTPLFIIGNGASTSARSNAMVVRKDGNVGLGTNNPRITLHVADGTDAGLLDDDGFLLIGNANGVNIVMDDNEIQARDNAAISDLYMQKEGGKVYIGAPVSPAFLLSVNGTAGKNGGGSWSTYSDRRLKEKIHTYSDGLDEVLNINPVWFQYNSLSGYDTKEKYVGVIAQELKEVSPYMVTTPATSLADGSPGYLQVDNSAMTYMLINAVKELHAEIENLKSEIMELRREK